MSVYMSTLNGSHDHVCERCVCFETCRRSPKNSHFLRINRKTNDVEIIRNHLPTEYDTGFFGLSTHCGIVFNHIKKLHFPPSAVFSSSITGTLTLLWIWNNLSVFTPKLPSKKLSLDLKLSLRKVPCRIGLFRFPRILGGGAV